MNNRKIRGLLLVLPLLASCGGSNQSAIVPQSGSATQSTTPSVRQPLDTLGGVGSPPLPILITLEDALPSLGSLQPSALYLGIDGVAVVSNGVIEPIATFSTPQIINVMAHQTGNPASIGIGSVYGGSYQQVQFTIDVASSSLTSGGQSYPLSFLTGATQSSAGAGVTTTVASTGSGTVTMTVSGNFTVGQTPAAAIQADFNAMESLVVNSDGSVSSRPVLFAVPTVLSGQIAGNVQNRYSGNPVSNAVVVALDSNGNVVNTAVTNSSGNYSMHTIATGYYSLVVYNNYTNASGQMFNASGQQSSAVTVNGPRVSVIPVLTSQANAIND